MYCSFNCRIRKKVVPLTIHRRKYNDQKQVTYDVFTVNIPTTEREGKKKQLQSVLRLK